MIKAKATKQTPADRHEEPPKCLSESVRCSMLDYFDDLDGHDASGLYTLFMQEVEKPFFEVVMKHANGNISHAAKLLGMNRMTLRNRLKKYGLT